jgi:hypothetical protein
MVRRMLVWLYMVLSTYATASEGRDHPDGGAVGIDVIGAVLGVVFNDEDGGGGPGGAVGDGVNQHAHGVIVIGVVGEWRESAGRGALSMIVTHAEDGHLRHFAGSIEFLPLTDEFFGAIDVGVFEIEVAR